MANGTDVWVLGGYQSDFARNFSREGLDFADLFGELVRETLGDAKVAAQEIGVVHVGNAFGQLFTGQGQLGAMPATVEPALWGVPAARHEAACASGSIAVLAAMADLRAGHYDCALVVGAELEKTVSSDAAAHNLGAAAWIGHEADQARFIWPYMFEQIAEEYDRRYGLDDEHLRAIADLNFANARRNPNAQTRGWEVGSLADGRADRADNPVVEGRLRRYDCSQVTDGGAGVVMVSDPYLDAHPELGRRQLARIQGWGHRTVGLGLQQKFDRSASDEYVLPPVRHAVQDAFARAGVDVDGIDGLETHDCFTPSEYLAIDHVGITGPGESWKAIENGDLEIGGRLPVNPSGGLIGGGHPVGATGVRMLVDASRQVTGRAGEFQVEGARTFATLNIGGSTTTTVSFVVGAHTTAA
jgi:acetyl-CoA C-acetyltransferase